MKHMKSVSTIFLKLAIAALGTAVLAVCIFGLPAMWKAVPAEYPSHSYVFYAILSSFYIAAAPFGVALYQALRLLSYIDRNKAFSAASVATLAWIAYCALAISLVFTASSPFFYIWADNDDAPGLMVISLFLIVAPLTISVFGLLLRRIFQQALDLKSENDLTV